MRLSHVVLALSLALLGCLPNATPQAELMRDMGSQVVMLVAPSNHGHGGTGFEITAPSGKLYTITNRHVCKIAENGALAARYDNEKRFTLLHVMEISYTTDLCILESMPRARGLYIGTTPRQGDTLYAIGHPKLAPNTLTEGTIKSRGEVSIPDWGADEKTCIYGQMLPTVFGPLCMETVDSQETTIQVVGGSSGSPVFNSSGAVVGVVYAGSNLTGEGLIVPLDSLVEFLSRY